MTIVKMAETEIIARDLLRSLVPMLAAFKDEREHFSDYINRTLDRRDGRNTPDNRAALATMDEVIRDGEAVVKRARRAL